METHKTELRKLCNCTLMYEWMKEAGGVLLLINICTVHVYTEFSGFPIYRQEAVACVCLASYNNI